MTPPERESSSERRTALGILAFLCVAYIAYDAVFLRRLTNVNFGDVEFTGWSSPFAARLLSGERPYIDFVLPIPPGSFAVLAAIQKIAGKAVLLQELWLNAVLQLFMALLAYFMARKFTTRKNALLTALATLMSVVELNKECAYDETAEFVAWASVAIGLAALFETDPKKKLRRWTITGFFAGFTFLFKQSTGLGITLGWALALAYLAGSELYSGRRERALAFALPARNYGTGVGLGFLAVWFCLVLFGSTARAYFRAVFADASLLKGGRALFAKNVTSNLLADPAFPASLAVIVMIVWIGLRIFRRHGTLGFGGEVRRHSPMRGWEALYIIVGTMVTFVGGAIYLVRRPPYPANYIGTFDLLKQIPLFGPVLVAVLFVIQLVPPGPPSETGDLRDDPVRTGHAMNAAFVAAFACSLLHNTSAPEFRPTYDNNPIVAFGFMVIFVALDRASLRWASAVVLFLMFGSLFGNKYYRALMATHPADPSSYWAGMRVSDSGATVERVAARVRKLAGPDETVLVLPEDLEIESLIGRPRPALVGGVVFVDQYAPRLVTDDLARLDEAPPKVIVIHPRRITSWQKFFRIWSGNSASERLIDHVLDDLLKKRYRRDSNFPTTFLFDPAMLDVYVRREPTDPAEPDDADTVSPQPEMEQP